MVALRATYLPRLLKLSLRISCLPRSWLQYCFSASPDYIPIKNKCRGLFGSNKRIFNEISIYILNITTFCEILNSHDMKRAFIP